MATFPVYKSEAIGVEVVKIGAPLFAQLELTENCTHKCFWCYNVWKLSGEAVKKPITLSRENAFNILEKLIECKIFELVISGGEPTLHPDLVSIIERAEQTGISTSIITNGSRLSRRYCEELLQAGLSDIQISMHHFDAERLDQITQVKGSFNRTLKGVCNALEVFGPEAININMVVTREEVQDVYNMGVFLNSLGVQSFSVGLVSFCGEAANSNITVGYAEFLTVYEHLERLYNDFGMGVSFTGGMPMCVMPKDWEERPVRVSNVCDAGIVQLVVGPDGGLRPCVEMPFNLGNALSDDIKDVWVNANLLQQIREYRNIPDICKTCGLVTECHGGCRAAAYLHSGSMQGYDPLMLGLPDRVPQPSMESECEQVSEKMSVNGYYFRHPDLQFRPEAFGGIIKTGKGVFMLDKGLYEYLKNMKTKKFSRISASLRMLYEMDAIRFISEEEAEEVIAESKML